MEIVDLTGQTGRIDAAPDPRPDIGQAFAACTRFAHLATRVCGSADYAARGGLLLNAGQLHLGPFSPVDKGPQWSWEMNPLADRSWQWRMNWLSFISYLLAHHAATGDVRAVSMAGDAALSWIRHYPATGQTKHAFEFAWHDHGTALRAEQLGLLVHYLEAKALWSAIPDPAAREVLTQACVAHAQTLARERFYSRHTNHGLEQARVLLLLGIAIRPALPVEAGQWVETATTRIKGELAHSFTDEGVHVENSPAYHVFVFKVFLGLIENFRDAGLQDLDDWLRETGPRAIEYISRILRPDRLLPIIGDTEALPVSDTFGRAFAGTTAYLELLYVLSKGAKGRKPRSLHRIYPKSGYAIFRSDWHPGEEFANAMHLVFKVGALSNYHRQQDDGTLVLYAYGDDWIIDSGLYNYEQRSPIRQYMRSRAAHNVWMLDRQEVRSRDPAAVWRVVDSCEAAPAPFIHAESSAFDGVRMVRRVSLLRRHGFRVDDVLTSTDGAPFSGEALWHVPLDKEVVVINANELLIRSRKSQHRLRVRILGDSPSAIDVRRGQSSSRVLSMRSNKAGTCDDSQVVSVTYDPTRTLFTSFDFNFEHVPAASTPS